MSLKLSKLGLRQKPSDITRLMRTALERPDMLSLAAGFTDNESLPMIDVCQIVTEIAGSGQEGLKTLQYGANVGRPKLREELLRRIEGDDTLESDSLSEESLFISNGSQQSLYLAIQTLCDPGDYVLVEQPTYFVFLEILRGLGVKPLAMPMNEVGDIDTEGLRQLLVQWEADGRLNRIKGLYLVSYFANPTGHSQPEAVKRALGALLNELRTTIAVIEDAAYRELYYETPHSARSCLAIDAFADLPLLYTSTLTKPYASGLKVGYAYCADESWRNAMLTVKGQQDFGTANFAQAIMERSIETGRFDGHLDSLRIIYRSKMKTLHTALEGKLKPLGWNWSIPQGGLYLWLRSPEGMRTDAASPFHAACLKNGVFYVPGDLCHAIKDNKDQIRLSFGALAPRDIETAAERFNAAAEGMTKLASS